MIENSQAYKKVYVFIPPGIVTGGPETLHSIVSTINDYGGEAYVFYDKKNATVPKAYSKYNLKFADKVEDLDDNLLVVSECFTDVLFKYKRINKAIVFLSVQFFKEFQIKNRARIVLKKRKLPAALYPLSYLFLFFLRFFNIKKVCNYHKVDFADEKLAITCNGEVNKRFLVETYGIPEKRIGYICGPLNTEFLTDARENIEKENLIAYNPKKGFEFTSSIIRRYSEKYQGAGFLPLEKMSARGVHEALMKSKVYIDFGSHPGPERIPREAAISNCNIITSNLGSAAFYEDVPIPDEFKFETIDANIEKIVDLIHEMVVNYSDYQPHFKTFKEKIMKQPELFQKNVLRLFLRREK